MAIKRLVIPALLGLLFASGCASDEPVKPKDDGNPPPPTTAEIAIPAMMDNTIYENQDDSNGIGTYMLVGLTGESQDRIRRGLIQFAIADSLLAGATVDSVVLELHMSRTRTGPQDVTLHKVNAQWGEAGSDADVTGGTGSCQGGGCGAPAEIGDATWTHRLWDTELWIDSVGDTLVGGDFVATASATASVDAIATYQWTSAQMVADVQDWLDNPGNNFGWLIMGDETGGTSAKRFDTRENTTAANRPRLLVWTTGP